MVMTRTGPSSQEVALRMASCNFQADLDLEKFDPTLHIMIKFLKSHPIYKPLTKSIEFPLSIIHTAYSTSVYNSEEECIEFNINKDNTTKLCKVEFLKSIGLPESKEEKTFYEPTNKEIFDVLDQMGYLPPRLERTTNFRKAKLPAMWHFLFHFVLRCLTGKVGGFDTLSRPLLVLLFGIFTGKEVDFGTTIWKDFASYVFPKKKEIPCARFWALALQRVYNKLKVLLPKEEEMFTPRPLSRYTIPDQSEFGKVACLPEAMLQYIEKNSKVLIRHREETVPLEPVRPTEGHTSSPTPTPQKHIVVKIKRTTGLGTKRKGETIPAPQAKKKSVSTSQKMKDVEKRSTVGSQSSTSHISLSSQEDDVSQKHFVVKINMPTKRKGETIPAPQAKKKAISTSQKVKDNEKRSTVGSQSQSSASHISSSSQEDNVSQKYWDITHKPPPSSQKEDVGVAKSAEHLPGAHSHINLEPINLSSPSLHTPPPKASNPGQESSAPAHQPLQTGFFGASNGEADVRTSENEIVRQTQDEQERQTREQSEREEKERVGQIEEMMKLKAAEREEGRRIRKELIVKLVKETKRKEDELKAEKQREQEEGEKKEALIRNDELEKKAAEKEKEEVATKQLTHVLSELREAEGKKEEEQKELMRMLREEQQKREEEERVQTTDNLLEHAIRCEETLDPSTKTGDEEESAQDMEKDFVFTADDGLIQDSDSPSSVETFKPSKSKVFLGISETESEHIEEVPKRETKTLPTTTVGTSRRGTKWKKKKKSKYISRLEFNSLNKKLSEVLEVVKKIPLPPSEEKFVSKEDFREMQKIVTSLAQSVPNLDTRERTLRESIVNDALREMEQKRTDDTFKYLDRMDVMVKMVKEIQQSYDDLTNTIGRKHGDEIVRISEQLCDYRNKNIILQGVLVKVLQSAQQLLRPRNVRFDEILFAIQKIQNSVDALPKTLSNDELSKQVTQSFQKVFMLIEDLKGSRSVDEAGFSSTKRGEDENLVITETPPPPPKMTTPPTECEIHEPPPPSPKIPSPPTSFLVPPPQIAPIKDKGKMPLEVPEVSRMKTFRVSEEEKKQQELENELLAKQIHQEQHALTPWVDVIRQLRDDELVPKLTTTPPSSDEYQWDIPMSPNAKYYSVFQPHLSREMQIPIELNRLEEFYKAHAQHSKDVWSLRRITRVLGYKKKSFQKNDYFGFEVVRSDNQKYYFSEADFPNLNPNDLYVIGRYFENKLLTHEPYRFPFLQIQRFLKSLIHDLGSIDFERPQGMNQELEGIENRHRGPTEDPELGIIFSKEKDSPRLFFRLRQKHLYTTKFLEEMIGLGLRSKASAALKVKIIEELEWWVAVCKWIKRATDLVTNKI